MQVFSAFDECKVSVDVVASSEVSVSMTIDKKKVDKEDNIPLLLVSRFIHAHYSEYCVNTFKPYDIFIM